MKTDDIHKGAGLVGRIAARVADAALKDGESMLVPLVVDGRIEHHGGLHAAYLVESGRGQEPLGGWSRSQAVALYLALKERRHMVYEALNAAGALVGPNVAESLEVERDKFTRGRAVRRGLRFLFGGNQR